MTDTPTSPKRPIWLRITLFLSLALNLLIAGLVGGFFLFSGPSERAARGPRDLGSLYTRALDQEDRRALRRDFARGLASQGRERGAIVMDVQAALEVLRATPFDVDAFGQALANQSSRRSQREEIGRQALSNRIAEMSDAERAAYADRVEDGLAGLAKRLGQ